MVSVSANAVEVVNEMVALLPVPTVFVKLKVGLRTAPVAGVLTFATVSFVVVISRPSVTAAFDLSSMSVHVTVTTPAASAAPTVTVIFLSALTKADVALVTGDVILHLSAA